MLYYVHRNILMVPFLTLLDLFYFFQIVLYDISFMKIKILKPKH